MTFSGLGDALEMTVEDFRAPKEDFRAPKEDFRTPKEDFRAPKEDFRAPKEDFRGRAVQLGRCITHWIPC